MNFSSRFPLSTARYSALIPRALLAGLFLAVAPLGHAQLDVEIVAGPNLIVDSNVLSPSTYAPETFTVQVKYCNNTAAPIDDVYAHIGNIVGGGTIAATPGIYPVRDSDSDAAFQAESPHLANTGDYSFSHAAVAADASRYIGTINPGECEIIYWMICYPRVSNDGTEPVWGATRLASDDLWLEMDAWASQVNAGAIDPGNAIGEDSHVATMRNSISAMANKIGGPTGGVWTVTDLAGNPVDASTPANPGEMIKVCGTGVRFGVDNKGFDIDPDFAFDYGIWMQPVGDKSLFDPFCYRLVRTEGQLRISRSGGNPSYVLDFVDQTYFRNLPNDSNGGLGDVCYFLVAMGGPCSAALSPYQLVASGAENEKFNGDYGAAVPLVVSRDSPVELTKTVDLDNAAAGATLTYDLSFTNPAGSDPLGLPEYGLPAVLNETIPTGTTYVGGSAEGIVATETTANSITPGSGGFLEVYYSTDGGASFANSEPGDPTTVTNIQWWLDSQLLANGTVFVQFQVLVDDPFSGVPLVDNTAGLSFGTGPIFKEEVAGTLISGNNAISGMVWEDLDYSDSLNAETQTTGVAVTLYYDANGDGLVDAGDILIGTQDTGAGSLGSDADSTYAFTSLPDGSFIVVVDSADADLPAGYSLPDSYADRYTIDLDAAGASGTGVDRIDNDWAFIPALTVAKTADPTTFKDGERVTFEIDLENRMAPVPPKECKPNGFAQRASSIVWTTPENAAGAPDLVNFAWHAASNNDDAIDFGGFDMGTPTPADTIVSIDVLIRNFYISGLLDAGGGNPRPDYIDIEVWDGAAWVDIVRLDYTTLHGYIGSSNQGDIAIAIPPAIVTAWTWATITSATQDIFRISYETLGNADGVTAFVDAVELVVTCPTAPVIPGTASPSTINPLPLTDSYDPAKLQYVSASISPTSIDGGTGTIVWDNVGPLHAGARTTIEVTFLALTPPDIDADSEPDPTTTTNSASSTGAMFLGGGATNDASDTQNIDIIPAGSIGDYIFWDVDGSGTQNAGDLPLQGVTVELLDGLGVLIASTATDASGFYEFAALGDASYTVRVAASNFVAGGALEGLTQTADPDGGPANQSDVTINTSDGISGNDSYSDQDFGYDMANNLISGTLWNDYDGDGVQDPNEPPIVGQTVTLSGGGSATTDANGFYIFSDVPDGNYTVSTTAPGGTVLTTAVNPIAVDADSGNAIDGTVFPDNDFGFQPSGSLTLGDTVYVDWDGDGSQGVGEEGIENISVYLIADLDGDGAYDPTVDTLVATDVTDASGAYGFAGLAAGGDYLVMVDTADPDFPTNLSQTADPDAALDSTGVATNLVVSDDTYDFGYQPLGSGSIGDSVFVDADADGIHDSGETGIAGITVTLYEDRDGDGVITAADAVIATTETGLNGHYVFKNLAPGDYLVDVDGTDPQLPTELSVDGVTVLNYIPTSRDPHAVTLGAGEAYVAADFGFAPGGAIGNFVWEDLDGDGEFDDTEPPISGMTVNLHVDTNGDGIGDGPVIGTTTTDANGLYLFDIYNDGGTNTGLLVGDYVVEIVISGTQTVTYDLDGNNDTTTAVALLPGQTFGAADFGVTDAATLVIGDTVWIDSNGDGLVDEATETLLSGVKVDLIAADGFTVVATAYTDSFGNYSFGVPDDGSTYSVVVDESTLPFAGLVNTTDRDADMDSDSGQFTMAGSDVLDADFGYQFSGAFDIAGTAFNDTNSSADWQSGSEPTYADVIVYLWYSPDNGTTWINLDSRLTGPNGSYSFDGYPPGTYTVAVSPGSPVLIGTGPTTPQNQQITVVDQSVSGVDFGFVGSASIGDTVFYDTNGDGIQGAGETGIPGVQVTLTYPNGQTVTTTTDSSGNYLFEGLGEGPYTITVDDSTLPAGTSNTGDPDGTKDSTTLVNLVEGQTYADGDFGYQAPGEGSIGDTVWADLNGDGGYDPGAGEFGIKGVVVELYPSGQTPGVDPPLATTTTDADGLYGFPGLTAGDYVVYLADTGGALDGYDPTYDEDGGLVSPDGQAPVTLVANDSVHDTADFGYLPTYASVSGTVFADTGGDDTLDGSGETPIAGVMVELWSDPNGDGDPSDGIVVATAITDTDGNYSFDGLLPGDYVVVESDPNGFTSDADSSGANDNQVPVDLQGIDNIGNDFLDDGVPTSAISGQVTDGTNPIPGVTITLKDDQGNVIDTAVTDGSGNYSFPNLPAGDYLVEETNPPRTTGGSDSDGSGNGDDTIAVILTGEESTGNDFVDTISKATNFTDFITDAGLDPNAIDGSGQPVPDGNGDGGNPDGDYSSNLLEHAFCDTPNSGVPNHPGFCVELVNPATGQIDASFVRAEGIEDVIYTLQGVDDLLGTWTIIATIPAGQAASAPFTVSSNGDQTETVTYPNLQSSGLAGLSSGFGLIRLCVSLDSEPDDTPDSTVLPSDPTGPAVELTDYTKSFGWQCVIYNQAECASFSTPFTVKPVFTGTLGAATSGTTLDAIASAGGVDLASLNLGPVTIGTEQVAMHYVQVTSGTLEGERFDIASASGGLITIVNDGDIFEQSVGSLNTSNGIPALASGTTFQVLPHHTIDSLFDKAGSFAGLEGDGVTTQPAKVLLYDNRSSNPGFVTYELVDAPDARWILSGDRDTVDQGARPLDRCAGAYIHPMEGAVMPQCAVGLVADYDLACPFNVDYNLVGAPYPMDQTATGVNGRAMVVGAASDQFNGGIDPNQAAEIYFWMGDMKVDVVPAPLYMEGYENIMAADDGGAFQQWVDINDRFLADKGDSEILESHRAVTVKILPDNQLVPHIYPLPTSP